MYPQCGRVTGKSCAWDSGSGVSPDGRGADEGEHYLHAFPAVADREDHHLESHRRAFDYPSAYDPKRTYVVLKIYVISIKDEDTNKEIELHHFLERAKEEKTQAIIAAFLKHAG